MKKQLLFLAAAAFAFSAVAHTPFFIKHADVLVPNFDNGKDLRCGNGLVYDPSNMGSIEDYNNEVVIKCTTDGNGAALDPTHITFETRTWDSTTPEAECCKDGDIIMAFDYKTNTPSAKCMTYTIALGDGDVLNGGGCGTPGRVLTVSDEWQTAYVLTGSHTAGWGQYGKMKDGVQYWYWLRFADINYVANPDLELYVKNFRMISASEAETLVTIDPSKDIDLPFTPANGGFQFDADDEGLPICMITDNDPSFNPIMQSAGMLYKLPDTHTIFTFDYQTTGSFSLNLFMWSPTMQLAATARLDETYEFGGDEWGKVKFDCAESIQKNNFAQAFATGHYLWIQCPPAEKDNAVDQIFYMINPRWTSEKSFSGIEDINIDNTNAPAVYYNLQGVQVANPANGLYIKKQGNTTTKVLVK